MNKVIRQLVEEGILPEAYLGPLQTTGIPSVDMSLPQNTAVSPEFAAELERGRVAQSGLRSMSAQTSAQQSSGSAQMNPPNVPGPSDGASGGQGSNPETEPNPEEKPEEPEQNPDEKKEEFELAHSALRMAEHWSRKVGQGLQESEDGAVLQRCHEALREACGWMQKKLESWEPQMQEADTADVVNEPSDTADAVELEGGKEESIMVVGVETRGKPVVSGESAEFEAISDKEIRYPFTAVVTHDGEGNFDIEIDEKDFGDLKGRVSALELPWEMNLGMMILQAIHDGKVKVKDAAD